MAGFSSANVRGERIFGEEGLSTVLGQYKISTESPSLARVFLTGVEQRNMYTAFLLAEGVFVIRAAGENAFNYEAGKYTAYMMTEEQLLADVFNWMDVKPGFVNSAPERLSLEEYEERIGAEGPWQEVLVGFFSTSIRFARDGGGALWEAIMPQPGIVEVSELPSAILVSAIYDVLEIVVNATAAEIKEKKKNACSGRASFYWPQKVETFGSDATKHLLSKSY